jgi:Domain of unknown function (DUF1981)
MVLARVGNVKSGWKSMFMVFTTAASDEAPTIVRLAFETIEKIVREHFQHITETETTTFTDCVRGPSHKCCPAEDAELVLRFKLFCKCIERPAVRVRLPKHQRPAPL